jgi:hypothetical protein
MAYPPNTPDKFWAGFDRMPGGCWLWRHAKGEGGYGRVRFQGRSVYTHRLAWELTHGPVPEGFDVLHCCDTPPCGNPEHLFLGTDADNAADRAAKGRSAKGLKHGQHTHPERTARGDRSGSRTHPEARPRGDAHWTRRTGNQLHDGKTGRFAKRPTPIVGTGK